MTLLLAEIRGWGEIAERIGRQQAERALSGAIDHALTALTEMGGHEVTLEGEPNQPAMSATFEGQTASIRALQAAVALRHAVTQAQSPAPAEDQFRVGIGVSTGDVADLETESGSVKKVGATRMIASRLREFAGAGQVFLSSTTYQEAGSVAAVRPLGEVRINAYGDRADAYCLTDLRIPSPGPTER